MQNAKEEMERSEERVSESLMFGFLIASDTESNHLSHNDVVFGNLFADVAICKYFLAGNFAGSVHV